MNDEQIEKMITKIEHFQFDGYAIPGHMHGALAHYVVNHCPTGGFLRAVLSNNLTQAVIRADNRNREAITAYVGFLYDHVPSNCWGSLETYNAWIETGLPVDTATDSRATEARGEHLGA